MLFKDGAVAAQKVGAVGRANLEEFLNKQLQGQAVTA
jgi:hypothetical protein